MVGSCDIVVAVGFNALDCVVRIEAELFQDLFVDRVVQRHELLLGKETFCALVLELSVPGVRPDLRKVVSLAWVYFKDFRDEVSAVWRQELRYFIVACQYFFIQGRCLRVVKW